MWTDSDVGRQLRRAKRLNEHACDLAIKNTECGLTLKESEDLVGYIDKLDDVIAELLGWK